MTTLARSLLLLVPVCLLLCVACSRESASGDGNQDGVAEKEPTSGSAQESEPEQASGADEQVAVAEPESEQEQRTTKPATPQMSGEAFRMAAHDGRLSTVRDAIESGMDVESIDPTGKYTALHMAAYNGHTDTVQYLIKQGAKVDPRDHEGKTPLIHACTGPFAKTVKVLIEAGADVNAKDATESFTPLMMAAGLGQSEIVQILLDNGADHSVRDDDNESALDHAQNAGHSEIVKLLNQQ